MIKLTHKDLIEQSGISNDWIISSNKIESKKLNYVYYLNKKEWKIITSFITIKNSKVIGSYGFLCQNALYFKEEQEYEEIKNEVKERFKKCIKAISVKEYGIYELEDGRTVVNLRPRYIRLKTSTQSTYKIKDEKYFITKEKKKHYIVELDKNNKIVDYILINKDIYFFKKKEDISLETEEKYINDIFSDNYTLSLTKSKSDNVIVTFNKTDEETNVLYSKYINKYFKLISVCWEYAPNGHSDIFRYFVPIEINERGYTNMFTHIKGTRSESYYSTCPVKTFGRNYRDLCSSWHSKILEDIDLNTHYSIELNIEE